MALIIRELYPVCDHGANACNPPGSRAKDMAKGSFIFLFSDNSYCLGGRPASITTNGSGKNFPHLESRDHSSLRRWSRRHLFDSAVETFLASPRDCTARRRPSNTPPKWNN